MAEGGGLLNRYTVINRIVGSNPIPSATTNSLFWLAVSPLDSLIKETRLPLNWMAQRSALGFS